MQSPIGLSPVCSQPRVLIVRLSAIGDVIQTMPVACAIKDRYPDAFVAWAVQEKAGTLLEGHEAVDELIRLPRGFLKSPKVLWALRRQLKRLNFDLTIDVQSLTKSSTLAWLSGAPRRIGFGTPGGREVSKWLNNVRIDPTATHVVDRYLELLQPLGVRKPTVQFRVPEREDDRRAANEIVQTMNLESGFALINPGAGWPSKLWPAERYAVVAKHLLDTRKLPTLVVWGGQSEREMADRIVAASDGAARLAPPTTLTQLASLARRASLFIGSDTGPLHLAAAVGTPCIGLYGPWPASRHGPYGPKNIALQQMIFEGRTRARRTAPAIYMDSITTEMVCAASDRMELPNNEEKCKMQSAE